MRPTDEDQPGSRRPNLMASSRRSASDVNILAMLDGLGSRPHAKRTLLWYGAGGVLACGLVGTLVWLVHEPATQLDSTMVTPALSSAASAASAPPASARKADAAPVPAEPQLPPGGAAIVNLADAETNAPPAPEPDMPATPSFALTADPAPVERPHSQMPSRPAPHAPAPKSPAVRPPSAHTALASGHPGSFHASPRRAAPAPKPAPAAVDTDVALISAIIQHAANQHDAAADGACGDNPCAPKSHAGQ